MEGQKRLPSERDRAAVVHPTMAHRCRSQASSSCIARGHDLFNHRANPTYSSQQTIEPCCHVDFGIFKRCTNQSIPERQTPSEQIEKQHLIRRIDVLHGFLHKFNRQSAFAQYRLILEQKMDLLQTDWTREGIALDNELSEESPLPLNMSIIDYRSSQEGASNLTQWMADFGLLGDRPGNEILAESVSEQLFQLLLRTGTPISLDDAHEQFGGQKARLGRILERFRACGLVERIPRTDRLATALWSAMVTQHQRRGEDWLLKKGGFMRLIPEKNHASLLQPLSKSALTIELVQEAMQSIDASDQMLLLNLLGGRLPLGYRLIGATIEDSKVNMTARLDRLLRRIRRVGTMIEEVMTTGDA